MNPLLAYFTNKGIPEKELADITAGSELKQLRKGDFFVEEGKTARYPAFVTKGMFRYYYLRDGEDITTYACGSNTFPVSVYSFFKQQPAKEYITALTDAELYMISHEDLKKLKKESNAFKSFYISALENLAVSMDETRTNMIILTAEERYALLMKNEPEMLQQIPLQYLASIPGVTPRHLSRIRSNY